MRSCGILMPVFSIPSPYGIGTMGSEAYRFVDFLEKAGQSYWQILPLSPTNYGDSPYQSFSSFAGNPYFIDLDMLVQEGLLTKKQIAKYDFGDDDESIDYEKLYKYRLKLLREAFANFTKNDAYRRFVKKNEKWLQDYALFMALKNAHNDTAWYTWEKPLRTREEKAIKDAQKQYAKDIEFYCFLQFEFSKQWFALKKYANSKGIKIIGDIPIYAALDSADVWGCPDEFQLDKNMKPKKVAGVPPDAFCEDGQLWGNPLYDWKKMKEKDYSWWKGYLGNALERYDVVRIDHFRAFESYFSIPAKDKTAVNGRWVKGPGMDLFNSVKRQFGENLPIIAEDLGFLTPAVHKLLADSGFPGMKVLQFAFDSREENDYLPHNYPTNCVVYTGTHDNDTIMGWTKTAACEDVKLARKYLNHPADDGFNWAMMKAAMMSVADYCILMMNDLIGAGSDARINTPSTLGGNWQWRIKSACINDWLASVVRENTELYGRLPKAKK